MRSDYLILYSCAFAIILFAIFWLAVRLAKRLTHENLLKSEEHEKLLKSEEYEKAKAIAKRMIDGDQVSLEEYLLVFPEACPSCGSRDFTIDTWVSMGVINWEPYEEIFSKTKCSRCGPMNDLDTWSEDAQHTQSSRRINSPYSLETPDFPYAETPK